MKTPMQELIEQLKQEIENQVQFRNEFEDGVVQGLEGALDLAEGMLEKEKEVISEIYDDELVCDTDGCRNDRDKCSCKNWGGCPVD